MPEFNEQRALECVESLMAIPGASGAEQAVASAVAERLAQSGLPSDAIQFDDAQRRSPIGGQLGNMIIKLPGTVRGPRRLLMAHLDTVPLCVGCQPYRQGQWFQSRRSDTALGGDNRAGTAVVLTTAIELLERELPHPPLTILLTVQEEIGLVGARLLRKSKLGQPKLCFNWDGGPPESIIIGATGADHLDIQIDGIASHAGAHPEDGVSAAAVAGLAIAELVEGGWHGKVERGKKTGASNLGIVTGGAATNVVMDQMALQGEVRSHDPKFRARIVREFSQAFQRAAKRLKNAAGDRAKVRFESTMKYEAFRMPRSAEVVQAAVRAVKALDLEPLVRHSNGGLDANWMTAHGFPTVTLGCGQYGIHTVEERLHAPQFLQACEIALSLATPTLA